MDHQQRQIKNTWRFEHGIVTNTTGLVSTASNGRPIRSAVGVAVSDISPGSPVLMLGSRIGETPIALGHSPWLVG